MHTPPEIDVDRLEPNEFPAARSRSGDEARLEESGEVGKSRVQRRHTADRRPPKVGDRFRSSRASGAWRAAKHAGLLRVPVVVRKVAPGQGERLREMRSSGALQRWGPGRRIEEALAYRRLTDEFQLETGGPRSQPVVRGRTAPRSPTICACWSCRTRCEARSRPDACRWVTRGRSSGHSGDEAARTATAWRGDVIARGLSVRETESLVKKMARKASAQGRAAAPASRCPHTRAAEIVNACGTHYVGFVRRARADQNRLRVGRRADSYATITLFFRVVTPDTRGTAPPLPICPGRARRPEPRGHRISGMRPGNKKYEYKLLFLSAVTKRPLR